MTEKTENPIDDIIPNIKPNNDPFSKSPKAIITIPIVAITGQVPTGAMGSDAFQEIDVFGDAGIDSLGTYIYSWNTSNGNISSATSSTTITASLPGSYTFEVLDTYNGCSTSVNTQVIQDIVIPNADAGVAQVLNCVVLDQQLDASGSSSGSIYEYNWSTLNGSIVEY